MKCRICGLDCPPGAKICRDCAAARKRAFAQTVTQPLLAAVGAPSIGEPRFAPRPARRRSADDPADEREAARAAPAALPLTVVPRKLGMVWLAVTIVVVGAIVVVWLRTRNGGRVIEQATRIETPPPPIAAIAPPAPPAIDESTPEAAVIKKPHIKGSAARPKKVTPHTEAAAPVIAAPAPPPVPVPAAPAVAPPSRPIETLRPDPWRALNEGLARCEREPLFDRIGCERELRLHYCGNSWGLMPQCPIGPAIDHGQ